MTLEIYVGSPTKMTKHGRKENVRTAGALNFLKNMNLIFKIINTCFFIRVGSK